MRSGPRCWRVCRGRAKAGVQRRLAPRRPEARRLQTKPAVMTLSSEPWSSSRIGIRMRRRMTTAIAPSASTTITPRTDPQQQGVGRQPGGGTAQNRHSGPAETALRRPRLRPLPPCGAARGACLAPRGALESARFWFWQTMQRTSSSNLRYRLCCSVVLKRRFRVHGAGGYREQHQEHCSRGWPDATTEEVPPGKEGVSPSTKAGRLRSQDCGQVFHCGSP